MYLRDREDRQVELICSLDAVKAIYGALFRELSRQSRSLEFDDFDDQDVLLTLQTYLQRKAREAGFDATIHSEWERFLGIDDASCPTRPGEVSP